MMLKEFLTVFETLNNVLRRHFQFNLQWLNVMQLYSATCKEDEVKQFYGTLTQVGDIAE